ncbi:hypothetical protein Atu0958 [Agrobacterium fabrum str. C58]|uniref:Uncharacterized protein n=1 Tax=Agrobacterium fabrum (strain C58 / ATCC 33970) TaxID=176299 RepID=Q8UGS7_AGRFC|nr:hypothetical protein Atu0958 [Agrobacterium fabrum str. C58]
MGGLGNRFDGGPKRPQDGPAFRCAALPVRYVGAQFQLQPRRQLAGIEKNEVHGSKPQTAEGRHQPLITGGNRRRLVFRRDRAAKSEHLRHMHQHGAFQRAGHIRAGLAVTGDEIDLDAVHRPAGARRIAQPQPRRARQAVEQSVSAGDICRAALTVKNQNRFDGLHRSLANQNHAGLRPPVEIKPPGLADEAKAGHPLQMFTGGAKQCGQKRVLLAAVETQMRLDLGKRQRLRLRRMNEGIGHGVSGRKMVEWGASGCRLFLLPGRGEEKGSTAAINSPRISPA